MGPERAQDRIGQGVEKHAPLAVRGDRPLVEEEGVAVLEYRNLLDGQLGVDPTTLFFPIGAAIQEADGTHQNDPVGLRINASHNVFPFKETGYLSTSILRREPPDTK